MGFELISTLFLKCGQTQRLQSVKDRIIVVSSVESAQIPKTPTYISTSLSLHIGMQSGELSCCQNYLNASPSRPAISPRSSRDTVVVYHQCVAERVDSTSLQCIPAHYFCIECKKHVRFTDTWPPCTYLDGVPWCVLA